MHLLMFMQAAAQTVATTAAQPTDNVIATGGLAVVVTVILQAIKNSNWFPWISRATSKINFWVGIVAAIASTAGIHGHYDMATGGALAIPGLHVIWQSVVQWASQQAAYKGLVVPAETLGEIRGMLEKVMTPPAVSEGAAKADRDTPSHQERG